VLLFAVLVRVEGQDWYRSNPSGMTLEELPSSTVALHYEWALSVETVDSRRIPSLLRRYYASSYAAEQRFLYKRGTLKRRQWIFRDRNGITRVNASLPADLAPARGRGNNNSSDTNRSGNSGDENSDGAAAESAKPPEEGEIPPFIEVFAPDRTLTEVHQYLAGGIHTTRYRYRNNMLIRADSFLDAAPLWTDQYRYTRSGLLRGVERIYHAREIVAGIQGGSFSAGHPPADWPKAGQVPAGQVPAGQTSAGQSPEDRSSANLPPAALDLRDPPLIPNFAGSPESYDYSIMTNVLSGVYAIPAARVIYDTDSRGRVLGETRYDEAGALLAEIRHEWSGDRIVEVRWTAGADRGRILFFYSGGDRVGEEDYKNGVLERKVIRRGEDEVEEIYMNGTAILRAVWNGGRKISEERLR
jgi:hypothetical protein